GGNNYTYGQGIALLAGIAYVTGTTNATTFPAVNAIQPSRAGLPDAFLTELNATGSSLYFSTYLGGRSFDEANAVALDPLANAYLAGDTKSTNFPSQNAFQGAFGGGDADAFIAKALFPTTVSSAPNSLNFDQQTVGTTSSPQAVTLSNTGTAPLGITTISFTGPNTSEYAQTNSCQPAVAPEASCTINVTFSPTSSGSQSAQLQITDNASGSPQSVGLSGNGVASGVSVSPASLAFGNQQVGTTSAPQAVTFSNTSNGTVSISSISITGTNRGDFAQTNTCPLSPATLAASTSCTINVTFTPTASGARSGTLSVADNAAGSPQTASLSGTGVIPTGSGLAVVQVQNNIDSNAANFYASFPVNITTNPGHLLVAFVRESSNGTDNFTVTDSAGQT